MTVVLSGRRLTVDEVVRVARHGEDVRLDVAAAGHMERTHRVAIEAVEGGQQVYGSTTGVGVLKRAQVGDRDAAEVQRRLLRSHRAAQGPLAPGDVVRACMTCLANTLAVGAAGVRPQLVEHLVRAINDGVCPPVRVLGSVGQADLLALADLAVGLPPLDLVAGEGLALLDNNAFATGWAALALHDTASLLDAIDVSGALALEAFVANLTPLHPMVGQTRPYPGLVTTLDRLRTLLDGSWLWQPGAARNLQDPLSFRCLPQVLGAARDALTHAVAQLTVELNSSQGNPIVVPAEGRVISVANFDVLPLAAALDYVRLVLASVLTQTGERVVKMVDTTWSGLPTGVTARATAADYGLAYFSVVVQALAAEARLLAAPVSFELASTSRAEGIEDRTTMAPLGARKLTEMVELGRRLAAVELVTGAQGTELRGHGPVGRGTARAAALVRERTPFLEAGGLVPDDLEPVVDLVRSGELSWPR